MIGKCSYHQPTAQPMKTIFYRAFYHIWQRDNTLSHGLIEDGEWYHWRSFRNPKTDETRAGEMGEDRFLFLQRTWVIFPASLPDGSLPLVILALLDLMHPSGF